MKNADDVNAADANGWTQLHRATVRNDLTEMQRLIADGADVSPKNQEGFTPLILATSPEAAKLLLDAGADPDEEAHTLKAGSLAGSWAVAEAIKKVVADATKGKSIT